LLTFTLAVDLFKNILNGIMKYWIHILGDPRWSAAVFGPIVTMITCLHSAF
jgi:hypothetical protein